MGSNFHPGESENPVDDSLLLPFRMITVSLIPISSEDPEIGTVKSLRLFNALLKDDPQGPMKQMYGDGKVVIKKTVRVPRKARPTRTRAKNSQRGTRNLRLMLRTLKTARRIWRLGSRRDRGGARIPNQTNLPAASVTARGNSSPRTHRSLGKVGTRTKTKFPRYENKEVEVTTTRQRLVLRCNWDREQDLMNRIGDTSTSTRGRTCP